MAVFNVAVCEFAKLEKRGGFSGVHVMAKG